MLIHKYELFKIESDESITQMFTHFTDIINGHKSLDKSCSSSDLVRKILRSLSRTWEMKVTMIQEAKNLNVLSLEELLGLHMTYELTISLRSTLPSFVSLICSMRLVSGAQNSYAFTHLTSTIHQPWIVSQKMSRCVWWGTLHLQGTAGSKIRSQHLVRV